MKNVKSCAYSSLLHLASFVTPHLSFDLHSIGRVVGHDQLHLYSLTTLHWIQGISPKEHPGENQQHETHAFAFFDLARVNCVLNTIDVVISVRYMAMIGIDGLEK